MEFSFLLFVSILNFSVSNTVTPLFCLTSLSCNRQLSFNSALSLPRDCLPTLSASEFCSITVIFNYLTQTVNIDYHPIDIADELRIETILSETVRSTVIQYHCQTENLCEEAYFNRVYNTFVNMNYRLTLDILTSVTRISSESESNLTCIVKHTPQEIKYETCTGQCQARTFHNDSHNWAAECVNADIAMFHLSILSRVTSNSANYDISFVYQCKQNVCNDLSRIDQIREMIRRDYEVHLSTLVSAKSSITTSLLLCLQESCNFEVSFNTTTLAPPDTCTLSNSSESCSMTVTFMYLTDTIIIQFDTIPIDDTLRIVSILPQTEEYGTVIQYHCSEKSLCEWIYLDEVYHQYFRLNYSSVLDVLKPENNFDLPPLSEATDLICIVNDSHVLCERGRCQAETFSNDSQQWEGSCSERSDFDQSTYKLQIVTRYNDHLSPYYDSFFTYQCYWNVCNTFEMVERIRKVIKADYEVQLPSLASTTTTTKATATTISVTTPTNSGRNNSTTTRMSNGCAHVDIESHVLLIFVSCFIFCNKS